MVSNNLVEVPRVKRNTHRRQHSILVTGALILALVSLPAAVFASGAQGAEDDAAATMNMRATMDVGATGVAQVFELSAWEAQSGPIEFHESPMTAAMVANGELPALEDRIPAEPVVVVPAEEIGTYGGTMNFLKDATHGWTDNWFLYEFPAVLTPDLGAIVPNTLVGWEANADATTWTLFIREGIRWSDGTPHTADDWLFYWNDMALNKDLFPSGQSFVAGLNRPGEIRKIDDHTIEIAFDAPRGTLIEQMTFLRPAPYLPAHYLKQFHPEHTDQATINAEIQKRGVETWTDVMNQEWKEESISVNRPYLSSWVPANSLKDPILTLKRNPYYFKVDAAGNQLPYMDEVSMESILGDAEAFFLKSISGEVDWFLTGAFGGYDSLPLAVAKGIENDFRIIEPVQGCSNSVGQTWFNFFHPDPVMRDLLTNKDFRMGLSHAVNREEMNQLFYKGAGTIGNPTLAFGPPFFGERYGQTALAFDLDRANSLLDQAGLSRRDSDGFRLRPDGQRLRILLSVPNKWSTLASEAAELYKTYWAEVGVDIQPTVLEWGTFWSQVDNSEHDISIHAGCLGGRINNPLFRPDFGAVRRWRFAPEWYNWIESGGSEGVEPPEAFKRYRAIRDEAVTEPDEAKRIAAVQEMMGILDNELFVSFGGVIPPALSGYHIASERLRNVPNPQQGTGIINIPAQFFLRQ